MFFKCLIILSLIALGSSIIAYDCSLGQVNKTTISLIGTKPCIEVHKEIIKKEVVIQVLQPKTIQEIEIIQCLVEITHLISRCGKTFDQFMEAGLYTEVPQITMEQCYEMLTYHQYRYNNKIVISLSNHNIDKWEGTTWGKIDRDGWCTGDDNLIVNSRTYNRAVRTSSFTILKRTQKAILNVEEDIITLDDGTTCKFTDFKCFSKTYGYAFWKPLVKDSNCFSGSKALIPIYQGISTKIFETIHNKTLISYMFDVEGHTFSLTEKLKTRKCGITLVQTEHPKLLIIEDLTNTNNFIFRFQDLPSRELNIMTYINSKLLYITRHTKQQVDELYNTIQSEKCRVEQLALHNLLSLARISPEDFAYSYFREPGYTAIRKGEVIYVAKCKPVSVSYRRVNNTCYDELPILYINKPLFLNPNTRLITNRGTEVECSGIAPAMYYLDQGWFSVTNYLQHVQPPKTLEPHNDVTWEFENIENLAEAGIYSSSDLERLQKIFTRPIEIRALSTSFVQSLTGNGAIPMDTSILNSFHPQDINVIENKIKNWWEKFLGSMGTFGNFISSMIGIVLIFKCFVFFLNMVINWILIRRNNLPCFTILFIFWDRIIDLFSTKNWLRHISKQENNVKDVIQNENSSDMKIDIPEENLYPLLNMNLEKGFNNHNS